MRTLSAFIRASLIAACFFLFVAAIVADTPAKSEETLATEAAAGVSAPSNGAWGESKLSDVVKGVAKTKSSNGHGPKPALNGPAKADALPNGDLAQSTVSLTPPTSPGGKKDKAAKKTSPQLQQQQQQQPGQQNAANDAVVIAKTPNSVAPPPCVSYAKMAEQNKDRLEQMAREAKERELEQERERRRVAQTSKSAVQNFSLIRLAKSTRFVAEVTANQGKAAARPSGTTPAPSNQPAPNQQQGQQFRTEKRKEKDVEAAPGARDRSKSP